MKKIIFIPDPDTMLVEKGNYTRQEKITLVGTAKGEQTSEDQTYDILIFNCSRKEEIIKILENEQQKLKDNNESEKYGAYYQRIECLLENLKNSQLKPTKEIYQILHQERLLGLKNNILVTSEN